MQTRWKTVIMTDCFTFTCYFSKIFPGKGRLILFLKKMDGISKRGFICLSENRKFTSTIY